MKKLLPLILTLCLLLTAAHALTIYDYVTAAENANADWTVYDETHYYKIGGVCVAVDLMQTDGCTLLLHE